MVFEGVVIKEMIRYTCTAEPNQYLRQEMIPMHRYYTFSYNNFFSDKYRECKSVQIVFGEMIKSLDIEEQYFSLSLST